MSTLTSALQLNAIFNDHMVLQRTPYSPKIYGTAQPNSKISILLDDGAQFNGTADSAGQFVVRLQPQPVSTGRALKVMADNQVIQLTDIAFGDVYLCSGQSNMEMTVIDVYNGQQEIIDSIHYPNLRVFGVSRSASLTPVTNVSSKNPKISTWAASSPSSIGGDSWIYFSATCFFYGRTIYTALAGTVPIGLVSSNWGGTKVEAWSSPDALAQCAHLKSPSFPTELTHANNPSLYSSRHSVSDPDPNTPSVLYNGMIYPLLNFQFAGAIWYQGEANSDDPVGYSCKFPAMINDWREKFDSLLPFYFVQLAPWNGGKGTYPAIRDAQLSALQLTQTGVAVTIDLGDPNSPLGSIHPRDKQTVGQRLAFIALNQIYFETIQYQGPVVLTKQSGIINGTSYQLMLDRHTAQGLAFNGTQQCTQCCKQSPFQLQYSGSSALVDTHFDLFPSNTNPYILIHPISPPPAGTTISNVLYDWNDEPECSVYNDVNLPMIPFNIKI